MNFRCNECGRNKFDKEGRCEFCETISYEVQDALKNQEYEEKKRQGKL